MLTCFKFMLNCVIICKKTLTTIVFAVLAFICGSLEILLFYVKQRLLGRTIPNFSVVDQKLFRGGQPSKKGVQELVQRGVGTIVNLRYRSLFTKNAFKGANLKFKDLPFFPYGPNESIVIEFIKIIKNATEPVFVHCFHGEDRTGLICAIYRIFIQGWDKSRAIEEMRKRGLHWWHKNLIEFVQNLDIQRIKLSCRL
jgi:tyrosine-protein phosphatase SIW14